MKYICNLKEAKNKIISLYPEFQNSNFVSDNNGWDNFVVKVDETYIFRFSRNEDSYRTLKMENEILKELNHILPETIKVPKFIYQNFESEPFVGYEMIKGEFLTQELYEKMTVKQRENLVEDMAEFLNLLHGIDVNQIELDVIEPISNYQMRYNEFQKNCFFYLNQHEQNLMIDLFESYFQDKRMTNYVPAVIHGDLSFKHMIVTENGIGIIDFGDVRIFDPAYDFAWSYVCDKKLFYQILEKYKGNNDDYFEARINFYIKIMPYYGIVYGDRIQNRALIKKEVENLRKIL